MSPRVLISIVTHNSGRHLDSCFAGLAAQTFRDFTVSVWDNGSADDTPEILEKHRHTVGRMCLRPDNSGFSAAHNRLIESATGDYVLVLNPDVVLEAPFLETLVREMDADPKAGSATGKLLRQDPAGMLDSTGMCLTKNQRHLDRGSGEIDSGQYDRMQYVFGASGAAAFYRRAMLEDVRQGTEYFDEIFFAYREDADLAWRAQWMGWRCLYVPQARARHERKVLPERRSSLPALINMHSFKNRFLLRIKNMDLGTYARFFVPITFRDLTAIGYVLLRERSSLPTLAEAVRHLPRAWRLRRALWSLRRMPPGPIRRWFYTRSLPL